MNRRTLPLLFMLTAGALTVIITFIKQYTFVKMLFILLIVMIVFYVIGTLMKNMLDYFDEQNAKKAAVEGEVVEKEPDRQEVEEAKEE